jgi:hypothetical protein
VRTCESLLVPTHIHDPFEASETLRIFFSLRRQNSTLRSGDVRRGVTRTDADKTGGDYLGRTLNKLAQSVILLDVFSRDACFDCRPGNLLS